MLDPVTEPIHVYVDGSRLDDAQGYGVYSPRAADGAALIDYGRVPEGDYHELTAIERALELLPVGPLVIYTDYQPAIRLAERPSARYADRDDKKAMRARKKATYLQTQRILAAIDARPDLVEFVLVMQTEEDQDAAHAVAHLLAFLGRTDRYLDEETITNAIDRITASPTPDTLAHAMVRAALFPRHNESLYTRLGRERAAEIVRESAPAVVRGASPRRPLQQGHPLSEDVDHFEATCPVHGLTLFARHRAGIRAGRQRYNERCLDCHAEYNLLHPAVVKSSSTRTLRRAEPDQPAPLFPPAQSPLAPVAEDDEVYEEQAVEQVFGVHGRKHLIHPHNLEAVRGRDLEAGMVLATGIILEVERDDSGTARLEMAGAEIHYVAAVEPVTVLAHLDREALDLFSVGVYTARHA